MTTAQFGPGEKTRNFFGFKAFFSGLAKQGTSTLTVLFVLFMAHSIHLLWALFSKFFWIQIKTPARAWLRFVAIWKHDLKFPKISHSLWVDPKINCYSPFALVEYQHSLETVNLSAVSERDIWSSRTLSLILCPSHFLSHLTESHTAGQWGYVHLLQQTGSG